MIRILLALVFFVASGCVLTQDPQTANISNEMKGALLVIKRIAGRKIRSYARDRLQDEFVADPSMRHREYERRLAEIQSIGKNKSKEEIQKELTRLSLQSYASIHSSEREKIRKEKERFDEVAEEPVDLINWGPIVVDQEGSIKFNPYRLFIPIETWGLHVAEKDTFYDEEPPKDRRPSLIFAQYGYDVTGRVRLSSFRPLRILDDPRRVIGRYSFKLRTDHYTEVTRRKKFSNNFEFYVEYNGDCAFFYSFEVPLR